VNGATARAAARAWVKAEAKAKAKAKAMAAASEVVASVYFLAADCLRLSMHFFHPIQQCAQHVYYTALPLSPTSSFVHESYLHNVIDNQLSHVSTFLGAPDNWGLLLRTIDVRPRQLTCITASASRIIGACGDTVNIYDAVTGVLQQFIHAPETVVKIQASLDGSTLFLVHSFSVTMWDVQTGGLINTFTTEFKINSIAVSPTHIACGLPNGSVIFWDIHTEEEGRGLGDGQSVVAMDWLSPQELAFVTLGTLCIWNIITSETTGRFSVPGCVWGMVYLEDKKEFLVGTSQPNQEIGQEESFFIRCKQPKLQEQELGLLCWRFLNHGKSPAHSGQLLSPTLVGKEIMCITPASGVQLFNIGSYHWTNNPPLLGTATSVAVTLNRNIVVQNKDSIQIFSVDVLTSGRAHNEVHPSHIYPLGGKHIICLKPTRHITLLELETLQELYPNNTNSPLQLFLTSLSPFIRAPFLTKQSSFTCASLSQGSVVGFDISLVVQAWKSGTPLPEQTEAAEENVQLCGWSPGCIHIVTLHGSTKQELRVKDMKDGTTLAGLLLNNDNLGMGEVYDIVFSSETTFHLMIDRPGQHIQIPYDIITSPSEHYSHTITKGEPVLLSEPRVMPPYTLDTNCEWVLDSKSRKICWVSPGDVRRGSGGHFWAGPSLIMIGDDGVVRKLTLKNPDS